ncbi:MAG: COX15/CtaA family protein [Burkholderiaceae bacterium]
MTAFGDFDFSPVLQLMLLGVVIAMGPLAWVWLRSRGKSPLRRFHQLSVLTLFLTFDLVLFGAFTRLSDSGLGCPDWPGCYGSLSPLGAQQAIAEAQQVLPDGPVTFKKAWIEMVHRYLATGVGVLILTMALASWHSWWRNRASATERNESAGHLLHPLWPSITLLWVCLQGAFGALTVTMKLFPAIVTLHLLGGLGLLALLCLQSVRSSGQPVVQPLMPSLTRGLIITAALLVCQLALGGWVSTNYAVLACSEFPLCQGSLWPPMNFEQGFSLWRPLGLTSQGAPVDFSALTAIHYIHRLFAAVLLVALGVLAWRLYQHQGLRRPAYWLVGLSLWQVASGVSNVILGWPLLAALAHTGGAAALVLILTWLACQIPRAAQKVQLPMVHTSSTGSFA